MCVCVCVCVDVCGVRVCVHVNVRVHVPVLVPVSFFARLRLRGVHAFAHACLRECVHARMRAIGLVANC